MLARITEKRARFLNLSQTTLAAERARCRLPSNSKPKAVVRNNPLPNVHGAPYVFAPSRQNHSFRLLALKTAVYDAELNLQISPK
jgi:hypothetical protein